MLFNALSRTSLLKFMLHASAALVLGLIALAGRAQPAQAQDGMHVVRAGELLTAIAQRYDVDVHELAMLNGIADPNMIVPGQSLIIPGTRLANPYGAPVVSPHLPADDGYYTVQRGDSLSTIALRFDMTLPDLMRLNGLYDPSFVWIGQTLRVTARAQPVAADSVDVDSTWQQAANIHVVKTGDSLSAIAQTYGTTTDELLFANGLPNGNLLFVGQRLRIPAARAVRDMKLAVAGAPSDGPRRIEIDLSDQLLTAYQGDVPILQTTVSTGKWSTPTVKGTFQVGTKYTSQDMYGEDYYLPAVPWVMYFFEGFAIHGAYWHANFGTPTSHGCVNMRPDEAEVLFGWADVGTEVTVYE